MESALVKGGEMMGRMKSRWSAFFQGTDVRVIVNAAAKPTSTLHAAVQKPTVRLFQRDERR